MKRLKLLLVEDDPNLGKILSEYLSAKSYDVTLCFNGKEGLEAFRSGEFQFCILDVMMPILDGFALAREIRKINQQVPLLFLTAKSMKEDAIEGFKLGADDYVKKPFSMEELILRMNAILRRTNIDNLERHEYTIGAYHFDVKRRLLERKSEVQKLTAKESQLLALFCKINGELLERESALKLIWGDDSYYNARSMDVYIAKLRKYLSHDPTIEILTVHGQGFLMVGMSD